MSTPSLPRPARTAGRVLAWTLGALLVLAVLAGAWIGVRGAIAYGHLRDIQQTAGASAAALAADPASAAQTLQALAADAADAHALTSDPLWRTAEHLPWVGPQLGAFAAVAASGDELLGGLAPLAAAAGGVSLDALRPIGGRIDPDALAPLAAPAQAAAMRADAAATGIRSIDRAPLAGGIARAVDDADTLFTQVATATDTLARTTQLLPDMLGRNGPRTYLVLVQNNAEWRSLGGIAGAGVVLHADGGALSLTGTVSGRDFGFTKPVLPLGDEVTQIFDTKPARYFQNVTQVPDFSVGAPIAREMYARHSGTQVDGVIAVDPVVLSYLLQATGPVTLPTGDALTADDAVSLLLNQVYFRYANPADQDAFFAGASGAVFEALAAGRGTPEKLVSALARAGTEHRLLVWSADAGEESVLEGTAIAGALPVTDAHTARFGVYLNDGTGSKMSYYTQPDVALRWAACAPAGTVTSRELTLDVTLSSTAPADAATSLPAYVTGDGAFGTAPGVTEVVSNIYLPEGFALVSATSSAGRGIASGTHEGRRVLTSALNLAPGETEHLTIVVRAATAVAAAEAIVTPTAQAALSPTVEATCGLG